MTGGDGSDSVGCIPMTSSDQERHGRIRWCGCGQPWIPAVGLFGTTEETECCACVLRQLLAAAKDDAAGAESAASASRQIIQYRDDLTRCFVDTEFYEDGSTIDLISIGAVRSDGGEFYAVNQDAKLHLVSPWVRANVLPQLPPFHDAAWMPRARIAERFSSFMGASHFEPKLPSVTEVYGYYSDYDWVAICQLYGTMMGLPNHFPRYCLDLKQLSWLLGNPKHPPQERGVHNALEDARWNRDLYAFLRTVPSGVWGYGR